MRSVLRLSVADIKQLDFCATAVVKMNWQTVCILLLLAPGCHPLWQALLNSLTTSSPLTWREAGPPPQVTSHTRSLQPVHHTGTALCFAGTLLSLCLNYCTQPAETSPFTRASGVDENSNWLPKCSKYLGAVVVSQVHWTLCAVL